MIRLYDDQDIKFINDIFNEVVKEGDSFLTEKPLTYVQMRQRIKNIETATYVAVTNEDISGAYMLRPNLKGRGNHIGNATYFVKKSFRGHGIGLLLGKHSIDMAKELGFKALQFNSVVSANEASVKLWNRLDFQTIGIIPNGFRLPNNELVDIFIMHRKL